MTAEGTARSVAGEPPKAELAAAKGVMAASPPEEKPAEEREGVGGPFVIVNGDSDGLSDRGSDMGVGPEVDSPSDEEDLPRFNAGPGEETGGVHGTAGGEFGALDAAVGVSSSNGHACVAVESSVESVDVVVEGEGEENNCSQAELGKHGTAGIELGTTCTLAKLADDRADGDTDSAEPAVDAEVNGEESERERSDVTELHEVASEAQQDGVNATADHSDLDDTPRNAESSSTVLESVVCDEETKGLHIAAEPMEMDTDVPGASMDNAHRDADMRVDSCVTATDPASHADEGKQQQAYSNVTDLAGKTDICGGQDGTDALKCNKHVHVDMSGDSCTPFEFEAHDDESNGHQLEAPTSKAEVLDGTLDASHADESKEQQIQSPTSKAEVLDGVLDSSSSDCGTCTYKEPTEEQVVSNGHGYDEDGADASGQFEHGVDEGEGEATGSVVELEVIIGNDCGGNLHNGHAAVVFSSDDEAKPPTEEGMDEVVPAISGMGVITGNNSEQIVQDDELVKDVVGTGKPELSFVESIEDQKVQTEVTAGDENAIVSDVKANKIVQMESSDSVQTQDLMSTVEDSSIPLHVNSLDDVNEKEVNKLAPAASTSLIEPRSIDLADNNALQHSIPVTELESYDHVQAEECSSQEISRTTVDQVTPGISVEHGTAVIDNAGLGYETGETSHQKSNETAVDQGEHVALMEDKAVVVDNVRPSTVAGDKSAVLREAGDISQKDEPMDSCADYQLNNDQAEICDTIRTHDEIFSTTGDKCSSPTDVLVSPVDEPHPSDVTLESGGKTPVTNKETCKYTSSENINACNKSSLEYETKCLEVLEPSSADTVALEGYKDDDRNAHKDDENIVEDPCKSHVDLDMSNQRDIQVIRPQKIFIAKVPRFAGGVWNRLTEAQVHLDQVSQQRDALNIRKKNQKDVFDRYREKFEAACKEESEARAAHGDKKNDLDSVRSMVGKLNKANSIDEIDEMITRKEKIMAHETISLKEEKLFIKEINELKAQRKQLCSNIGSKAEINEAFQQKDHIHEQHKILKKDSDVLFKKLKSLAENTRRIKKSLDDERAILKKMNDELQTANEVRQKAFRDWAQLRREPARMNKCFFMYKSDHTTAYNYIHKRDMHGLQSYCNNQIEGVMEMWNKDDDFRKLYVESNEDSTLRRLGTPDGRQLGPGEDPPVISRCSFKIRRSNSSLLTVSSPNVPIITSEVTPEKAVPIIVPVHEDSFPVLPSPKIAKQVKPKVSGSSSQKEITTVPASEREDVKDIEKEKARLMEELELKRKAEDLARMEEELRQERAVAEKERLRLEQKAKAKEAEERKKKKAEKAQERAEFKARKEAEMKEKKKAKKVKKTTPADLANVSGDCNFAVIATEDTDSNTSENARDAEFSRSAAPRRSFRSAAAMRQLNRSQPMPLPLRNRGRRRMRQYILMGVAVALSLVALGLAVKFIEFPSFTSLLN